MLGMVEEVVGRDYFVSFKNSKFKLEIGTININTGKNEQDNTKVRTKNYITIKKNTNYKVIITNAPNSTAARYMLYDKDNTFDVSDYFYIKDRLTFNSGNNTKIRFYLNGLDLHAKIKIEEVSTYNYQLTKLIDYPAYYIDYSEDYKLDNLLSTGVSTITELESFASNKLMSGRPFNINTLDLGCNVLATKTYSNTAIQCRNLDIAYSPLAIVKINNDNGYNSINTVPLKILYSDVSNISNEDIKLKAIPYCCTDGMNSEGLAVSLLQVFGDTQDENKDGATDVIVTLAIRALLDKCATTDEAITMLNGFNMHMIDTNYHIAISDSNNNHKVVEYFNNEMSVYDTDTNYLTVTNFLLNNKDSDKELKGEDRFNAINAAVSNYNGYISEDKGLDILQATKQGTNQYGTVLSAIYNATNKNVTYYLAQAYDKAYTYSLYNKATVKSILAQGILENDNAKVEVNGKHLKVTLKKNFTSTQPLYVLLHNSLEAEIDYTKYTNLASVFPDANVGDTLELKLSNYKDGATTYTEMTFFNTSFNSELKCTNSSVYSLTELTNSTILKNNTLGLICVIVGSSGEIIETDVEVKVNDVEVGNNVVSE